MNSEPEVSMICTSLLNIQKNIETIKKTATNPYFKSKYAKLADILPIVKELLDKEGLLLVQPVGKDTLGNYVATEIRHPNGEGLSSRVYLTEPADMQKLGAAITYARRFGLVSLLALEEEDDDGESTVGRSKNNTTNSVTNATTQSVLEQIRKLPAEKAKVAMLHLEKIASTDQEGLTKLYSQVVLTLSKLAMKEMPK